MKKLFFILIGLSILNSYANNCGGEFQASTGTCRIIGPDGKMVIYNSAPAQSGSSQSSPKKIIRYTEVEVPPKYGALALDENTGALGGAVDADSLAQAQKDAIRQCNSKGCKVVTWVKNGCIAAAGGKLGNHWKLSKAAENRGNAERVAMNRCKKAGISNCQIIVPEACSIPDISKY